MEITSAGIPGKLILNRVLEDGTQEYIVEGMDKYRVLVKDGRLKIKVVATPGLHAGVLTDGIDIIFEHKPLQLKTVSNGENCRGPKVYECTNLPVVGRYGLYHFSRFLYEASKYMGVCFVNNPEDADIVHLHQVGTINIPPDFEGKKIIVHFHGFKPQNYEEYRDWFSDMIFISNYQRVKIFDEVQGNVVWNGVLPYPEENAIRHYHFVFAQAAYDAKNPDWVRDNVSSSSGFRIAIAGELSVEGADNYGYLDQKELQFLQASSHIFVMPSKKEAFGLAPLYAMLQGTVPAVSINSGIIEAIPGDLMIAFDPDDTTLDDLWREYRHRELWKKRKEIRDTALWLSPERWANAITEIIFRHV